MIKGGFVSSKVLAIDLFYELIMMERRKRGDLKVPDIPDDIQCQANTLSAFNNEIRKQKEPLIFETQGNSPVKKLTEDIISHPNMQAYHLTKNDVVIISNMVSQILLPFHNDISGLELLKFINMPKLERLKNTYILTSLLDRRILKLSGNENHDIKINNPVLLLQARFEFDTLYFNAMLGSSIFNQAYEDLQSGIKDSQNEINAYMMYFETLFNNYPELSSLVSKVKGNYFGQTLAPFFSNLCDSFHKLRNDSIILDVKQQYDLKDSDLMVLLLVYYHVCYKHQDLSYHVLLNLFTANQVEAYQFSIEINESNLIRNNVIRFMHSFIAGCKCVYVHERIIRIYGAIPNDDYGEIPDLEDILNSPDDVSSLLAGDNRLTLVEPTKLGINDLILQEDIKDIITTITKKISNPEQYNIANWLSDEQNHLLTNNSGNNVLLFGPPGTGKTLTANVIAHALNIPLIRIESTQLRSKWYGESEQNLKRLFSQIKAIAKDNPCIFLWDEVDQIMHSRQIIDDDTSSCREVENAIQSIILEELNDIKAVMIYTTNKIEQLDEALSRRINYKIELPYPDEQCRKKLWKLHLPNSIPGAIDIDIDALAKQFEISGGQIKLIIQNACSEAIVRDNNQFLTQQDLNKYLNLELSSSFENNNNKKIGFGR